MSDNRRMESVPQVMMIITLTLLVLWITSSKRETTTASIPCAESGRGVDHEKYVAVPLYSADGGARGCGEVYHMICPDMKCGTIGHDFVGNVEDYIHVSPPQHRVIHPIAMGATTDVVAHPQLRLPRVVGTGTYYVHRDVIDTVAPVSAKLIGTKADTKSTDTPSGTAGKNPKYFYTVTAFNR